MHYIGISPSFLLSDKDFSQISAASFVWPETKIQICKWHIKKAVMERLRSNKSAIHSFFNPLSPEGKRFPFNNITPSQTFCPKELRDSVWNLMEKHLHQHPYIPTANGQFFTAIEIYESAIEEVYKFCRENSLVALWCYLWCEWYNDRRWHLWAQSACTDKIPIIKTTMFIEGHWKMIKRDFLYKFFRPRLDLLVFILTTKVIKHQKHKFKQIQNGHEKPDWKK